MDKDEIFHTPMKGSMQISIPIRVLPWSYQDTPKMALRPLNVSAPQSFSEKLQKNEQIDEYNDDMKAILVDANGNPMELEKWIEKFLQEQAALEEKKYDEDFTEFVIQKQAKNAEALTELNFSGYKLPHFPLEFTKMTNLTQLFLPHNEIKTIPNEITQLTNLKVLSLGYNPLESFPPPILKMTHLEVLYLAGALLKELPKRFPVLKQLTVLDLSNNIFDQLPQEVCKLTSLKELYFAAQPQLNALPESISNLQDLKILELSWNKFTEIPVQELKEIRELRHLIMLDMLF